MSKLLLALLIGVTVSGCAITPGQQLFIQDIAQGVRRGALASSAATIATFENRPRTQQTRCRPDYTGGFTCVTSEQ